MTDKNQCSICDKPVIYKCEHCGKHFCEDHENPKITMSFERFLRSKDIRIEAEWRKENAHPCVEYGEWLKIKEKERIDRAWESLERLKRIPKVTTPVSTEISESIKKIFKIPKKSHKEKPSEIKKYVEEPVKESKKVTIKISNKIIVALIIFLIFVGWYLYSNPRFMQLFFSTKSENTLPTTTTNTTTETITKEIPYILNYPQKVIYFQSTYKGKINESLIGIPIQEKLQEGWKIEYIDLPEHSTTSQKISVEITTIQTVTITSTIKADRETSNWLSGIWFKFSSLWISNCTDGTLYNQCSINKPYYCSDGALVKNSTFCGCPYDYKIKGDDCEKIQRCNDGTIYGECSSQKPFYCLNGNLVKKSSLCGCPTDEISQVDECVSKFQVGLKEIQLSYLNGYITYTVYKGLNDYLASLPRSITYYKNPPTTKDFIMKKLDDQEQKKMLDPLVDEIKKITPNIDDQARIAIRLVQSIPYDWNSFKLNNVTGKYPYEVLYANTGVCSEKAQLLVYLLRGLGYGVATLEFTSENHEVVGIKCPSQYTYKNTGYCFVEPTELRAIGDSSGYYVGVGQLTSNPEVIVISDGYALNSIW